MDEDPNKMNRGDITRAGLLVSTASVGITSLGSLVFGVVLMNQDNAELSIVINAASVPIIIAIVVLLGLQTLVSGVGFVNALRLDRSALVWVLRFTSVFILLQIAAFIFVLLMGNGVRTGNVGEFAESTEAAIAKWTIENPAEWETFQNENDCCGFNFRATYNSSAGGYDDVPPFALNEALSGSECLGVGGLTPVQNLQDTFPEYSEAAQEAADDDPTLRGVGVLCKDFITTAVRSVSQGGGIALGVLVFFQAFTIGCLVRLLFSIREEDGGLRLSSEYLMPDSLDASAKALGMSKKERKLYQPSFSRDYKKKQSASSVIKFDRV